MNAAPFLLVACLAASAWAQTGRELMEDSIRRHAHPDFVYQEQTLILSDKLGQNTVRTARYYERRDTSGRKSLLVIQTPVELRGASLFTSRDAHGGARQGPDPASPVFGSDFTVADFEGEQPADYRYALEDSQDLDRVSHYVLLASPRDEAVSLATGYGIRRIYMRKDNLFVNRIDYLDRQGNLVRRRTFRDPRPDESGAWRAGMILTEDLRESRRTLVKIERRVHSPDYVPVSVFDRGHDHARAALR